MTGLPRRHPQAVFVHSKKTLNWNLFGALNPNLKFVI